LKLGFSHVKGLGTINTDLMEKKKQRKSKTPEENRKPDQKNGGRTRAKTKQKPRERNNTQREGEERKPAYTENCPRHCLHLCRHSCTKNKTPKTNSQQAGIIFLVLKAAEKKKGKHRPVSTEKAVKTKGNRRQTQEGQRKKIAMGTGEKSEEKPRGNQAKNKRKD
jgi:hypothetical protein